MNQPKAALLNESGRQVFDRVYGAGRLQKIARMTGLIPDVVVPAEMERRAAELEGVEVIFSTWGMPSLSDEHLRLLPSLKALFYAAGSVQGFARPYLQRGVTVVSAWAANAVPVAEFTVAQMLLANKGYFRNIRDFRAPGLGYGLSYSGPGNYGETVALLGAGQIGRKVIELLAPFHLSVIVFDPFLTDAAARQLGVEKVSLEDGFARGLTVSNHLANLPATEKMIAGHHFKSMRENATFINTGRGATVREAEMIEVLTARPDLTALLDVTHPEPPASDSPLLRLPNVHLTTHIAGSIGDEVVRLADYVIDEFQRWQRGEPLHYAVTLEMLDTMA